MSLQIQTLGSLQILQNDQPLAAIKRRKEQALLVYLACQPGVDFSREHLQGLLWGESAKKQAANSLRQALSSLRKHLPPDALQTDGPTVAWNPDVPVALDIHRLDEEVHEEPEAYGEPFLHGFVVRKAPLWEEWVESQRERIRLELLASLLRRGEESQGHDPAAALAAYQQALLLEPWRESTHRRVMWLHWRMGDRAAALAQYETCVELLSTELDVPPSPETEELAQRIQQGDDPFPTNLPHPSSQTPFVGRGEEQRTLVALLAQERLVTLIGLGGIGKTRLSLEVARALLPQFRDGVFLVELVGAEPEQLPTRIAEAVALQMGGSQPAAEQLADFLRDKRLLLLLDNFEHLLAQPQPVRLLQALLANTRGLHLLVTSRERLHLRAERVVSVDGLPYAAQNDATQNGELAPAVALFAQRATSADGAFALTAENRAQVQTICQMLEGMPLAIELAASWTRVLSCQAIAEEIAGDLGVLRSPHRDVPDRQRSLNAVLDATWRMLSRTEQRQLQALTVFRGSFDRHAAEAVAGISLFELAGLIDKSLLYRLRRESAEGDRFRLHEQLRQFAAQQLRADSLRAARVAQRHAAHFAQLLADSLPGLKGADQQAATGAIGADLENIYAAWRHLLRERAYARLLPCVEPLSIFYKIRTWLLTGQEFFAAQEQALQAGMTSTGATPAGQKLQAYLQLHRSSFLEQMLRFEEARALVRAGLAVAQAQKDRRAELFGLNVQGTIAAKTGAYEEASGDFEQALAAAREVGDQFREAGILNNLGILSELQNKPEQAMDWYDQSVRLHRAMHDEHGLAIALDNRGICAERQGQDDIAWNMFSESLAICRRLAYPEGTNRALNNLGVIALDRGRFDESRRLLQEAVAVLEDTGKETQVAYSLRFLSLLEGSLGNFDEAIALAQKSLAILERFEGRASVLTGQAVLARVLWQAGDAAEARGLLLRTLGQCVAEQQQASLAEVLQTVVELCRADAPDTAFAVACWMQFAELDGYLRRFRAGAVQRALAPRLSSKEAAHWRAWAQEQTDESVRDWLRERLAG